MRREPALEPYIAALPRKFTLRDGSSVELTAREVSEGFSKSPPVICGYVEKEQVDAVRDRLHEVGFKEAVPATQEGEKYGLSLDIGNHWELHLRIFPDGSLESHVEVSREYFEHLGDNRIFVVYEPFQYLFPKWPAHLFYRPAKMEIASVEENFEVKIPAPTSFTPWKPVVVSVALIAGFAAIVAAIASRKGDSRS